MRVISQLFINVIISAMISVPISIICGLLAVDLLDDGVGFAIPFFVIISGIITFFINLFCFGPLFTIFDTYFKERSVEETFISASFILLIPTALYAFIVLNIENNPDFSTLNTMLAAGIYFLIVNGLSLYFLVNKLYKTQDENNLENNTEISASVESDNN